MWQHPVEGQTRQTSLCVDSVYMVGPWPPVLWKKQHAGFTGTQEVTSSDGREWEMPRREAEGYVRQEHRTPGQEEKAACAKGVRLRGKWESEWVIERWRGCRIQWWFLLWKLVRTKSIQIWSELVETVNRCVDTKFISRWLCRMLWVSIRIQHKRPRQTLSIEERAVKELRNQRQNLRQITLAPHKTLSPRTNSGWQAQAWDQKQNKIPTHTHTHTNKVELKWWPGL